MSVIFQVNKIGEKSVNVKGNIFFSQLCLNDLGFIFNFDQKSF